MSSRPRRLATFWSRAFVVGSLLVASPWIASPWLPQAEAAITASEAEQPSPIGTWETIDDSTGEAKSHVKIYERDGKLYGKIIKPLRNPDATCDKCTGDDKGKPIKGLIIMWALQWDGSAWSGGKIFDPEKGKTYRCKIWIEGKDLKVRGYWGPFFRTQTWHRV